jgi:membrane fusion protein, heavy metal efflux system
MSDTPLPVVVTVLTVVLSGCGPRSAPTPAAPAAADVVVLDAAAQQHADIQIGSVGTAARSEQAEASGILALDERRTARIGSLVEAIVLETFAEVGDHVRAGQVLATMHSHMVHDAWASYRKAIADRRRLEKELAFSVAAHERARRLLADKAISLQELQRAEADRVAAEEALDMGRTEVRRSEEEMQHLGITNADDPSGESGEQIPVKSPTAGVVLERLVTPGTAVTSGTPLYVVSDLSSLWALIEIDESLLSVVRKGQRTRLRVTAYGDETFEGTVALISDVVNPRTRRVTVKCVVGNRDARLKPQMFVTAIIRDRAVRDVVVVPASAIQTVGGQSTVFVAEAGGRFRPRVIDVGPTLDGMVEVRSGLQTGEQIATAGSFVLKSELLKSAALEE